MALPTASDNPFPSLLIVEGTEPAAPAAGRQRLYIDSTTHKLKRTDSSGVDVTIESSAGASGTGFPGSPSTNDRFFRTDRGLEYYYDGTRWLSMHLYAQFLGQWNGSTASGQGLYSPVWEQTYDQWLVDLRAGIESGNLGAGAHWTITLYKKDGASAISSIATVNNAGATNGTMTRFVTTIGALLGTGMDSLYTDLLKTGSPTAIFASAMVTYRLVG